VGASEERAWEADEGGGLRFGRGPVVGTRSDGAKDCTGACEGALSDGGAIRVEGLGFDLGDGSEGGVISDGAFENDGVVGLDVVEEVVSEVAFVIWLSSRLKVGTLSSAAAASAFGVDSALSSALVSSSSPKLPGIRFDDLSPLDWPLFCCISRDRSAPDSFIWSVAASWFRDQSQFEIPDIFFED